MQEESEKRRETRAMLCGQIDRLERDWTRLSLRAFSTKVDALRSLAAARRMAPLATVAGALSDVLAVESRRTMVRPYLDAMREAAGCDCSDAAATETFLALVSVRLAH